MQNDISLILIDYRDNTKGRGGPHGGSKKRQALTVELRSKLPEPTRVISNFRSYLCNINSFSLKDCFYTEALRDRLNDAPATICNRGHGANRRSVKLLPDYIKTSCRGSFQHPLRFSS